MRRMNEHSPALAVEASRLFAEYLDKIERSAGLLSAEQIWWRPEESCNSVGNLLLHLCGNLSQWVLAGLGGRTFDRRRNEEFAAKAGDDGAALIRRLRGVVSDCLAVVGLVSEQDLGRTLAIQGYDRTGFGVLLHAVEHMSYHTGQIVAIAKQLVGRRTEIEFYPHLR
jgi:uncharacterized damage-inducible protein DinB